MTGNPLRRLLARIFGPPDWHADPEFIAKLQAEAQSRHGIVGDRRDELAAEMLADGQITPTQCNRMLGRESWTPLTRREALRRVK